jgi:hypothetical protein
MIKIDSLADYDHRAWIVIRPAPTGVIYTNQSGGMLCTQPEIEGYVEFLIPDYDRLDCCICCEDTVWHKLAAHCEAFGYTLRQDLSQEGWLITDCGAVIMTPNCD